LIAKGTKVSVCFLLPFWLHKCLTNWLRSEPASSGIILVYDLFCSNC